MIIYASQCFPLYWYEAAAQGNLFGENMKRCDGISDFILNRAKLLYGGDVKKGDIFYYVYGFLHLPGYRERFANELKKIFAANHFDGHGKILGVEPRRSCAYRNSFKLRNTSCPQRR